MDDKRLEDSLKAAFSEKHLLDERLKQSLVSELSQKRKSRENALLYVIQITYLVLNLMILAAAFLLGQQALVIGLAIVYVFVASSAGVIATMVMVGKNRYASEEGELL